MEYLVRRRVCMGRERKVVVAVVGKGSRPAGVDEDEALHGGHDEQSMASSVDRRGACGDRCTHCGGARRAGAGKRRFNSSFPVFFLSALIKREKYVRILHPLDCTACEDGSGDMKQSQ